jgi:hypothetical protein
MIFLFMMLMVVSMGALLWTPQLRRCAMGDPTPGPSRQVHALKMFVLIATAFWCYIAIRTGAHLDYEWYLLQWDVILKGVEPPWVAHTRNAYGPLYNMLAYLTLVDPFAPKLLFVFVWCWATAFLIGRVLVRGGSVIHAWALAVGMLATPYFPIAVAHYGFFDILPAGLCLLAVHLRIKNRDGWAGSVLAAAVLLKFYPIALLPFLMLDGRKLRIRLGVWCVGLFALGMFSSYLVWGESTWRPLIYAAERPSKYLSIFVFLRGAYSPLGIFMENPNVDFLTVPSMVVFGGTAWLFCWWKKVDLVPACIAGMSIGLQFYKAGHIQFLAVVVLLIMYWVACGGCSFRRHKAAVVAAAGSLLWWTVFIVIYSAYRRYARPSLREIHNPASLVAFSQTIWLVLTMIRCRASEPD